MMAALHPRFPSRSRQAGVVLFVSLVILLMLSLFALAAANNAVTEQKMAGAARNQQLALLSADSAMSEAKARISAAAATYGVAEVCSHLRCLIRASGSPQEAADLMRTEPAQAAINPFRLDLTKLEGADGSARLAASPGYVIEDLGAPEVSTDGAHPIGAAANRLFRITALGYGGRREYEHAIESIHPVAQ